MEYMKLTSGALVFLLAAGSGTALAAAGQSLAELAKKEKERQKKVKDVKVITEQDLPAIIAEVRKQNVVEFGEHADQPD